MVIVRIKGGLGNQLFQYATGYTLAKRLGCELKLDVSFYPQQSLRNFELKQFEAPLNFASYNECIKLGAPINLKNKLLKKLKLIKIFYSNYIEEHKSYQFDERLKKNYDAVFLDGYWQNLSYFENERIDLIKNLRVNASAGDINDVYLSQIKKSKSVSVHVRRGDYVNDFHTSSVYLVCDLKYYLKSMQFFREMEPNTKFFIFSDDISWCKDNFENRQDMIFVENTRSALEDFELIRKCKGHIISNSTFSWWSAWLSDSEQKSFVVYPSRWRNDVDPDDISLNCSEWISM